jgi:hypothetical protein
MQLLIPIACVLLSAFTLSHECCHQLLILSQVLCAIAVDAILCKYCNIYQYNRTNIDGIWGFGVRVPLGGGRFFRWWAAEGELRGGDAAQYAPARRVPLAESRFFPSLTKTKLNVTKIFRGIFCHKGKGKVKAPLQFPSLQAPLYSS